MFFCLFLQGQQLLRMVTGFFVVPIAWFPLLIFFPQAERYSRLRRAYRHSLRELAIKRKSQIMLALQALILTDWICFYTKFYGVPFVGFHPLWYSVKETPRNDRLTALSATCLHIFRHLAQILLEIRRYSCVGFIQADEKSDGAIHTQSLCGVALKKQQKVVK